jgi:PAS domain S-box-containing protein
MAVPTDPICVLHVDDEPDFADLAATFLEREDERFRVETAIGAGEGAAYLAENDVDCVVSDYDMPGENGIEFLETVRADYPDLPFILYTGKGSEEVASEAISAGVTDYLQKESATSQYTVLANRIINAVEGSRAKQQRQRQLEAIETAQEGISILEDERFIYVNEAYAELYGHDPEEMIGEHWSLVYPDEDVPHIRENVIPAIGDAGQWHGTTTGLRADGSTFVEDHTLATTDSNELVCTVRDITDKKERQQELQQYKNVLEAAGDAVYALDLDGRFITVNERYVELTGYDREELIGTHVSVLLDETDIEEGRTAIRELLETDQTVAQHEETIHTAGGDTIPVEARITLLEADDGTIRGSTGVLRNITDRKEHERELKRQNEELEELTSRLKEQYLTLFEEAPIMAVITRKEDGAPIIEDCNAQFVETLGYDKEAVVERELSEFYTPESRVRLLDGGGYERSLEGEFTREDRDLLTADGERVETVLRAVPYRDRSGTVVGTLAMYIDITEREELKRANERLDEFASIISHDLRNPLNIARGRLELAKEDCDTEHLDRVERAHERIQTLIGNLLTLAREGQSVTDPQSVALESLIESCWANVETSEATLVVDIDRTVRADESRLKQLFENLIRNSVEHGGEDVTIRLGSVPGGFYFEDDGPGISEKDRKNIFDVGYSTTPDGTGFGLSIVEQIATDHDWEVRATDGRNGGLRFEITGVEFGVE